MTADTVFELQAISKSYEDRQVLQVDHLFISAGQVLAVEGPNGAGKSTLLGILALLLPPDSGRLIYRGRSLFENGASPSQVRREVTLLAQDPYFFQTTVMNNVAYGLRLRGVGREKRRRAALKALEMVGLEGFRVRRARTLSGGEAQRVALARALVLNPRVLLLDEPFANLDRDSMEVFEKIIKNTSEAGCAVVLVSHDQEQVRRLAHRVVTLAKGSLVQETRS
ncbi:MAG: ATP-binding cassette domain-containing protein [Desulfarculaceae bacterium]|jgi:tungstate transport system ATP-binding protein